MGNQISRDAFSILPAKGEPMSPYVQELLAETYTVRRTSGDLQGDWMVTAKPHICTQSSIVPPAAMGLWNYQDGTMRFHMHNGSVYEDSARVHACGWRPLGGFWPSRLNGDEEAQQIWTEKLREFLMPLHEANVTAFKAEMEAKHQEEIAAAAPPAVKVTNPLPDPLSARDLKLVEGGWGATPEKPTEHTDSAQRSRYANEVAKPPLEHGCGYFDGAPWDTCFACEYEKDPEGYYQRIRHSQLVQMISAQYRDTRVGERVRGWSPSILQKIVDEIQTPRERRQFTDVQIHDKSFQLSLIDPHYQFLQSLRALCRV
jgi:hypothetical protein